ncbi:MAG: hypothetical protein L6Q99_14290 [Planctomycetes bacterium]|nr:hypothetical protein [Planctomycetota bacterium]
MKPFLRLCCLVGLACGLAPSCRTSSPFETRAQIEGSLDDLRYVAPGGAWSFEIDRELHGVGHSFVDGIDGTGGRYVTRRLTLWGSLDVWVAPVSSRAPSVEALGGVERLADTQSANRVRELESAGATVHILSRATTQVQCRAAVRHVYEVRAPNVEARGWQYFLLGKQERWYVEVVDVVDWGDALVRFTGVFELNSKQREGSYFNATPVVRAQEVLATPEATFARPAGILPRVVAPKI